MKLNEIINKVMKANPFVFRNNRGGYYNRGHYVRYGIPEPPSGRKEKNTDMKGSDYIGFRLVEITQDMVGKKVPVFSSIEVKTRTDKIKEGQLKWLRFVRDKGGIAELYIDTENGLQIWKGEDL